MCCIIFDIDGMLFDFFMNFLNIEKNTNKFSSIFQVFFAFHAISNIKKKNGVQKKSDGGGVDFLYIHYILYSLVLILYLKCGGGLGGGGVIFFSHFMLFPTFLEKQIWE